MSYERNDTGTNTAWKEAQSYLTVLYIVIVGVGMLYEYHRYNVFGINIFQFGDIFDFLIAPLRDMKVFRYIVLSLLLVYVLFKWDEAFQRGKPRLYNKLSFGMAGKPWFPRVHKIAFALLFLFYLQLSSVAIAKENKRKIMDTDHLVTIRLSDNQVLKAQMIGRTNDNIIVYKDHHVSIISVGSIKELIATTPAK
jgi:hypothetical protein